MQTSGHRRDEARLSCPVTGTELADRLQSGLSLEEALGERPVGSVSAPVGVEADVPGTPRRSWVFAGLLAVSLMGWPLAFYQGKVAETAEAERSAQELVAHEQEELRVAEQAHAARVQEQNDILDRKQAAIVLTMQELNSLLLEIAGMMDSAIADGRFDRAAGLFFVFCSEITENEEIFAENMEEYVAEVRAILEAVDTPGLPGQ